MRCKSSWGRWADDDDRAPAKCVCVGSCLVTTTAWHWDWHWHWHWLSPFAIAEPQSWCSLSWIFHVIHHINAICMFIPPLCLLASTDLNNFYSLWQPLILHRQLQFSIIFRGSRLSTSPWSSSPPFQSQQQALFLLPLLLWLINCGHFVCAEIPTKAVTTDTWPAIKTLWARTRASDALRFFLATAIWFNLLGQTGCVCFVCSSFTPHQFHLIKSNKSKFFPLVFYAFLMGATS